MLLSREKSSSSPTTDTSDSCPFGNLWDGDSDRQTLQAKPAPGGESNLSIQWPHGNRTADTNSTGTDPQKSAKINSGDCGSGTESSSSSKAFGFGEACSPATHHRLLKEIRNRLQRLRQLSTQPQTAKLSDPDWKKLLNRRLEEIVEHNVRQQREKQISTLDQYWVELNVHIPNRVIQYQWNTDAVSDASKGKGGAKKTSTGSKASSKDSQQKQQQQASGSYLCRMQADPHCRLHEALQALLMRLGLVTETRMRQYQISLNGFLSADEVGQSRGGRREPREVGLLQKVGEVAAAASSASSSAAAGQNRSVAKATSVEVFLNISR